MNRGHLLSPPLSQAERADRKNKAHFFPPRPSGLGRLQVEALPPFRLHEVSKYHTEVWISGSAAFAMYINKAKYAALPADVRQVLDETTSRQWYWKQVGESWDKAEVSGRQVVAAHKNEIYTLPAAERQRWREAAKGIDEKWATDLEAKGLPGQTLLQEAREVSMKCGYHLLWDAIYQPHRWPHLGGFPHRSTRVANTVCPHRSKRGGLCSPLRVHHGPDGLTSGRISRHRPDDPYHRIPIFPCIVPVIATAGLAALGFVVQTIGAGWRVLRPDPPPLPIPHR
jgi:hypothetical protein